MESAELSQNLSKAFKKSEYEPEKPYEKSIIE